MGWMACEIYGSLGYDDLPCNDFDLIVANVPGKAGEAVIAYLLRESRYYLSPGGMMAIVVVAPLEEIVAKTLAATPGVEIILQRNRSGHAVFHYRFSAANTPPRPNLSAFERGVYHRQKVTMRLNNLEYTMQTAYGLPEFDSLSYGSEMLVKALFILRGREIRRAAVFNPGQGHVPAALWQLLRPQNITLVDRDLLALRYSRLNLTLNGCPAGHSASPIRSALTLTPRRNSTCFAAFCGKRRAKPPPFSFSTARRRGLAPAGTLILAAGSTAITRLVAHLESQNFLRMKNRERRRGYSLLVLERV